LIDPEELEREKGVIVEEIKRGEDEPGDHVHDLHLESLWSGHELGKPIIGTRESVVSFQPSDLKDYIGRQYRGTNLLLSVAGNVEPSEVAKALDERLAGIECEASRPELARPVPVPGVLDVKKDIEQVHFCIGTEGVSSYDEDLYAHAVMDGVLGSGMSSRLFQEVRERRGLAYAIGSYSLTYTVGGAFTVYGGTGAQTWPQVQEVVRAEFDKLMVDYVSDEELNKVKQCLSGMIRMAKNEFVYGRDIPLEETITKIQAVKPGDIVEIARERLSEDKIRTTSIGPA
jgi:predicted Zn-dependent peptidase